MKTNSLFTIFLFYFLSLSFPSFSERCNPKDKKVLLQIKQALNNPYDFTTWNPDTDCCTWDSLECHLENNRIKALTFVSGNISGQIPPAVGDLPFLETLMFLDLIDVTGEIPSAIAKLSKLQTVRLTRTKLTGPVPSFFSKLKALTLLDLSSNQLTGSIPPSLSLLPNLTTLYLHRNRLAGRIPESFGRFAGIINLDLSHNQLTGSVPKSLITLGDLKLFDVSYNRLCGQIPVGGNLQSFSYAEYSHNRCLCGAPLPAC